MKNVINEFDEIITKPMPTIGWGRGFNGQGSSLLKLYEDHFEVICV